MSEQVIYSKRLPLEDEDFKEKYWNKNNNVFMPVNNILRNNGTVYFRIYQDNTLLKNIPISSINFKRGDIFLELETGDSIKIPMNMILVDSYTHYNHENVAAFFKGSDNWRVSENSDVSDFEYMITSFEDDKKNPLLNSELPIKDEEILSDGTKLQLTPNSVTFNFGGIDGEEYDDDEDEEEHDDDSFENWNHFFDIMNAKNNNDDIILISVFKHEDDKELDAKQDLVLSGQLQEITVNDDEFKIQLDSDTIEILESLEEIDVHIPEDTIHLFGIIPCTVKIQDETIDALVSFSSVSKDEDFTENGEIIENNFYEDEEEVDNENIESWNSLFEYIDIMFKIGEPVFFSIHDQDTKEVVLYHYLTAINFEGNTVLFTVDSGREFKFNMDETLLTMDGDFRTRMFSALFTSNFVIDDNGNEKEFAILITNKK